MIRLAMGVLRLARWSAVLRGRARRCVRLLVRVRATRLRTGRWLGPAWKRTVLNPEDLLPWYKCDPAVSGERARQIAEDALERLRHPSRTALVDRAAPIARPKPEKVCENPACQRRFRKRGNAKFCDQRCYVASVTQRAKMATNVIAIERAETRCQDCSIALKNPRALRCHACRMRQTPWYKNRLRIQ